MHDLTPSLGCRDPTGAHLPMKPPRSTPQVGAGTIRLEAPLPDISGKIMHAKQRPEDLRDRHDPGHEIQTRGFPTMGTLRPRIPNLKFAPYAALRSFLMRLHHHCDLHSADRALCGGDCGGQRAGAYAPAPRKAPAAASCARI